jgi:nitronate monooxygenase
MLSPIGGTAAKKAAAAIEGPKYRQAFEAGDPEHAAVWFGEAAGLVHSIEPAAVIVERMVAEAAARLRSCTAAASD